MLFIAYVYIYTCLVQFYYLPTVSDAARVILFLTVFGIPCALYFKKTKKKSEKMYLLQSYLVTKKDVRSNQDLNLGLLNPSQMFLPTEPLALEQWIDDICL